MFPDKADLIGTLRCFFQVWRIVLNKPYGLENYRGLEEKVALLDQALNLYDSSAVIIAILHMRNSLKKEIFIRELSNKPDAVDQYVAFLTGDGKFQECLDLLDALGRAGEKFAELDYR